MPFVRKAGIKGLVWMPARRGPMKHPCADCYQCAWCSDERCESCLAGKKTTRAKPSEAEEDGRPDAEGTGRPPSEPSERSASTAPPESKPPSGEGGEEA